MSSPAHIARLASESAARCVLVEIEHAIEVAGAPATGTLYLSNTLFATGPADTPANISYIDCIDAAPSFSRSIDPATLGGRARIGIGSLELNNADGRLRAALSAIVCGQVCRVYLGDETWPRADFAPILTAIVDTISAPSPDRVTITLRDASALLDKRIAGDVIGGSGPNANRRKPIVIGAAHNVEAVLGDAANLRYWAGGRAAMAPFCFGDVRDNGASLAGGSISGTSAAIVVSTAGDTFTYAGHPFVDEDVVLFTTTDPEIRPAAAIVHNGQYWVRDRTASTFKLASTRGGTAIDLTSAAYTGTITLAARGYYDNGDGSLDIAHTPAGTITVDVQSNYERLEDLVAEVVLTHAGLAPTLWGGADILDSFWTTSDEPHAGYVITEPTNAIDVLDALVTAGNAFWAFTLDGLLRLGRIRPHSPVGALTLTVTEDDLVRRDAIGRRRLPAAYQRYSARYQRTWHRQTSFAAAVTLDDVARYSGPGLIERSTAPTGTAYSTNPGLYHLTLTDAPEDDCYIAANDDATAATQALAWANERRAKFAPFLDVITLEMRLTGIAAELGGKLELDVDRTGMAINDSTLAPCIGIDVDLTGGRVTLTCIAKTIPDYLTAAHYG